MSASLNKKRALFDKSARHYFLNQCDLNYSY